MAGVLIAACLAVLLALAVRRFAVGYPEPSSRHRQLAPREVAFLRAATDAMFPANGAVPVSGSEIDAAGYVDGWFGVLHPAKRLQIRLLLVLFEHATLLLPAPGPRGRLRFSSLSLAQRVEVLRGWYASPSFVRRTVFTALRSVLGIAYLGHPATMRHLRVAPYAFDSPVVDADLLYPPIGESTAAIAHRPEERATPVEGPASEPIALDGPPHPDYAERPL